MNQSSSVKILNTFYELLKRNSYIINAVILAFLVYFAFDPNLNPPPDLFHDSELIVPAQMSAAGLLPFKDIYLQHGYLRNLLFPIISFKIFGSGLESVLIFDEILYVLCGLGFYLIFLHKVKNKYLILLIPVIVVLQFSRFEIFSRQIFSVYSVLFFLFANSYLTTIDRKGKLALSISGFFAGLAFFHSLEVGVYTIVATICFLILMLLRTRQTEYYRALLYYSFGLLIVVLTLFLFFLRQGVLFDFFQNTFNQVAYQSILWGQPGPDINMLLNSQLFYGVKISQIGLWYLNIMILLLSGLLGLFLLFKRSLLQQKQYSECLLLILLVLVFSRTAFGRSDLMHLIFSQLYTPLLLVSLIFVCFSIQTKSFGKLLVKNFSISLTLLIFFFIIQPRVEKLKHPTASNEELFALQQRIDFMKSEIAKIGIEDKIFVLSNQGAYYYYLNRLPASKFFNPVYAAVPELDPKLLNDLIMTVPAMVIVDQNDSYHNIDGPSINRRMPLTYQWLDRNYKLAAKNYGVSLYVPI